MKNFFLTPASISYLNQFLLGFMITVYLGWRFFRHRNVRPSIQDKLLFFFFVTVTIFLFSFFLDVSLLPTQRLFAVYIESTLLALILVALLQFAYHFPQPREKQRLERRLALVLSVGYLLWEAQIALTRYNLLRQGRVVFRKEYLDFIPPILFAWVIIIFLLSNIRNWKDAVSRRFAAVFFIPLFLTILNIFRTFYQISTPFYHISMSVGILATLFLFANNYLAYKPELTSFMVKFSGAILTSVLAVFGIIGWLVTPIYATQYQPNIIDHRSIQFIPSEDGDRGYEIAEIPFHFDVDFGQKLAISDASICRSERVQLPFVFSFFGDPYTDLFICDNGLVSFGQPLHTWDMEYKFSNVPIIFAMGLNLNPDDVTSDGIYLREEPNKVVVTFNQIKAFYHPELEYTFQIILQSDGRFSLTYNGLPTSSQFLINDRPDASIWVIGAKPAQAPEQMVSFSNLPLTSGPEGILQDEYLNFRKFIHVFLVPLAGTILFSSLLLLIGLPLALHFLITLPLNALLNGVAEFFEERKIQHIPVQFNDEVGFLTASFNELTGQLDNLIHMLETRVAERTTDLVAANNQLRKLSIAVEQSPSSIMITNLNAEIEYINPAFTHTTGYTFEDVKGKNPRILKSNLTPMETYQQMWQTILSRKPWRGELINMKKTGEAYWEYTVIAPIYDDPGNVTHYVAVKEDITIRKAAEEELELLATSDPLTGLNNRRHLLVLGTQCIHQARRYNHPMVAMMIDIDHFKKINDMYGHATGDNALKHLAEQLRAGVRSADIIGRYGGEEFVILMPETSLLTGKQLAERLLVNIRNSQIETNGTKFSLTISVGIAELDQSDHETIEDLIAHADRAMYTAKQNGRDQICSF
jgi:diguanylate cyclase (GGDEF)-like protein/PAS domain S-box-containing protein